MLHDHSVEIYVPTECRCGKPLPEDIRDNALEEVKSSMGTWFGGGSVKKADIRVEPIEGFWPLASGDTANERVDVVYSNATGETLEEHSEELASLTADLANRLTQEAVACRVDGKMSIYPCTQDPKPHRCAGGASTGELPAPLQPDEKDRMCALQASLQRISSVRDVRDLFCHVLHYAFEDEEFATVKWPDELRDCLAPGTAPRIIADQNGFKILYLQLAEPYLRRGHERQLVQRLIKDDPTLRGLVVVSDADQREWHLVNAKFEKDVGKNNRLRLRRMRVGSGQSVRTAVERLAMVDIETAGEDTTAAALQDLHDRAFDVESVSKEFFNEISNWYFWALSQVEFPTDTLAGDDNEKHRATSLIRFLTRMIFCWFLKEKDLIPPSLFREKDLTDILVDLDDDSSTYHQGILQNLFFATLNQRMGKDSTGKPHRAFAKDEGFPKNKSTYGVDTLYRYEEHFQDPDRALSHFADVPFLNGGLFECLDRTNEDSGKRLYVDGFSRNKKKRARVPNELFFSGGQTVDLSDAYGDKKWKKERVRGLLNILHAYNFTVEENTPIDEEIALDPELLGKVFENLLASYNEETKTTARKQTGSFYTPRPIVEYMVDESLKAHLTGSLVKLGRKEEEAREQLGLALGYTDDEPSFSEEETDALLEAIHTCKILDPACGSGAFPIGMLQKLVHVVHKLDPHNARWKQLQIDQASKIPDSSARAAATKAIERDFEENGDEYGRKLYLIENCLYGVDIQPIAIQISKLRFFISLICDQKTNRDKAKNHGIRALPNLETKFVAANTLIGLPEMGQLALVDPRVNEIETEIELLYHRHFSIQRRDQKLSLQKKLKELRKELGQVLADNLGSSQKAAHLAQWDPFDSQASSDFFDPHWMFGQALATGFDVVIGNPPYGFHQIHNATAKKYFRKHFAASKGSFEHYFLFYEAGLKLLNRGGILSYIAPVTWLTIPSAQALREFVLRGYALNEIAWLSEEVFQNASVNTLISFISRATPNDCRVRIYEALNTFPQQPNTERNITQARFANDHYYISIFSGEDDALIVKKIRRLSRQLAEYARPCSGYNPYEVGSGIAPGGGPHTRQTVQDKPYHSTTKRGAAWKPEIGGKDLSRYHFQARKDRWVRYGPWLSAPRDPSNFTGPRILVREITGGGDMRIIATFCDRELHHSRDVIPIKLENQDPDGFFLLGVANSWLISWFHQKTSPKAQKRLFPKILVSDLKKLPIPDATSEDKTHIAGIVSRIIDVKKTDPAADTSALEAAIDEKVYELFDMTPDEIRVVTGEEV